MKWHDFWKPTCPRISEEQMAQPSGFHEDALPWVWLSLLPSIRGTQRHVLAELAGGVEVLMHLGRTELQDLGVMDPGILDSFLSSATKERAGSILQHTERNKIGILFPAHPQYPQHLLDIPDYPAVLYWKGKRLPENSMPNSCVAIVGSRRATGYGLSMARELSSGLSEAGYVIVSGLARGIDTAAHSGALQADGSTIAVLGNGLDSIYPPENRALAERIMETGCLLSEFEPSLPPAPFHFPMRNRIISGLSRAVIVVEASMRSGSLITVGTALEQGREVLVVPGNATSVCSRGCNQMIREGAELVSSVEDVMESLHGVSAVFAVQAKALKKNNWGNRKPEKDGKHGSMLEEVTKASRNMVEDAFDEPMPGKHPSRAKAFDFEMERADRHACPSSEGSRNQPGLGIPERIVLERLEREALTPDQIGAQSGLTPPEVQQVLLSLEIKRLAAQGFDGKVRKL